MKYELNYEYFKWIRIMNQLMALAFIELVLSEKVHADESSSLLNHQQKLYNS